MTKTFHVWHRINPTFMDNSEDVLVNFPVGFVLVARVQCEHVSEVFQLTNSITAPWWANDNVTKFVEAGCRSTSVGDVITTPDMWWTIQMVGLKEF